MASLSTLLVPTAVTACSPGFLSVSFRTNASGACVQAAAGPKRPSSLGGARQWRSPSNRRATLVRCADSVTLEAPESDSALAPAITLTPKALSHLSKMRSESNKDLMLRIGVRQGGCSGFSYVMDFEERGNVQEGDSIIEHEGFAMVCDPKSLLFLYGMQLDYSDALIGGGFSFSNPNASATCGCGKSFAA